MDKWTFYIIEDVAKDWSDTATIVQAILERDEYIAELEKEIEKLKSCASVEFPTSIGG